MNYKVQEYNDIGDIFEKVLQIFWNDSYHAI